MRNLIPTGLFVVLCGMLAGWYFDIVTTLVLGGIGLFFVVCILIDLKKGGEPLGRGSGAIGVFILYFIPGVIFVIVMLASGLIFHFDDLLYMVKTTGSGH